MLSPINRQPVMIVFLLGFILLSLIIITQTASHTYANAPNAVENPEWSYDLPGLARYSSPAVADINGDGKLDIAVATENGYLVAVKHDGTLLWEVNLADYVGTHSEQKIRSSPTIGDLNNDGSVEIAILTGSTGGSSCYAGGIMVFSHNGNPESGWPFLFQDGTVAPNNCPDGGITTAAFADLDNNGDLEIITAAFDKRIYVLHHNGTVANGFPTDSYLRQRFSGPGWENLEGKLADTIWSSPVIADMDGDGYKDIILGVDEGHFGNGGNGWNGSNKLTFENNFLGWYCPYRPSAWGHEYCGGSVYGLDRNGNLLDGFPKLLWEHIQSTPLLVDLNDDNHLDIVHGTGTYYDNNSIENNNPAADRIIAWDGDTGNMLAGWNDFPNDPVWNGGIQTGDSTPTSPAAGDLDGDGDLEIIILAMDSKVYAFHHNGNSVNGFPMTPRDRTNKVNPGFDVQHEPVMADYDGDGDMEIFLTSYDSIVIVDGNGSQITGTSNGDSRPVYKDQVNTSFLNAPAVVDVDNDCRLELISAGNTIRLWELPDSSAAASWPMYKHDGARVGVFDPGNGAGVLATTSGISVLHRQGSSTTVDKTFMLANMGNAPLNWSITNLPDKVSFNNSSGTLPAGHEEELTVTIAMSSFSVGTHDLGAIIVEAENGCGVNAGITPDDIPVSVTVARRIYDNYLPYIGR